MSLTRWNPTRDLLTISDEMNRLIGNVFEAGGARETSMFRGLWTPSVDISEDNDNFYLQVELPGMTQKDIKVRLEDGQLVLTGEKKINRERDNINFHRVERTYGAFERSFRITSKIIEDKISADFADGVLSIVLPKAEEVKPKEIEVKIK